MTHRLAPFLFATLLTLAPAACAGSGDATGEGGGASSGSGGMPEASVSSGGGDSAAPGLDSGVAPVDGGAPPGQDAATADAGGRQDSSVGAPDGGPLPPMKTQKLLIGYSEAWFGANFGSDFTTGWDLSYVQKVLDGIAADGGHLVRIWLWEIPQGFTLAASPPYTQAVSQSFLDNVETVLVEARRRGLWVYVTLLDANTIDKITPGAIRTWGVNLLNNAGGELDAFDNNAVAPLLGVLDRHQDNVFGIDMVNEIQACSQNGVFPDATNGPRAFLQAEAAFIHGKSPWVKVTSSAGWPSDILQKGAQYDIANGLYTGLGLDFYDLHAYDDSGSYSGATAMCARAAQDGVPVYLGEFGQSSSATDDTLQYNATGAFLNNSASLCFKGAFAWRFDPQEGKFSYVHADFSPRPAVAIMQTFGALP